MKSICILFLVLACSTIYAAPLRLIEDSKAQAMLVLRPNSSESILVQNVRSDHRPYLHPIVAPDSNGVQTDNTLVIFTSDNEPWTMFKEFGDQAKRMRGAKETGW